MKKGFTLIELLAVVTILGILALIATPMILNVIEDTKKSAAQASANEYINGLNIAISTKELSSAFTSNYCTINSSGLTCSNDELEYNPKGTKPTLGYMAIENGEVRDYTLCIGNYKITQQGDSITTEKDSSCYIEKAVYVTPGLYRDGQLVHSWEYLLDEGYFRIETTTSNGQTYKTIEKAAYMDGFLYISDDINSIGGSAFANTGLTGLILPEGIDNIDGQAFKNNKIKSLTLPSTLTRIGMGGFWNNEIETLTFPSEFTEGLMIDEYGFRDNKITSLAIPSNLYFIGPYTFAGNPISTITVDSNNPNYDSRNNCNAIIHSEYNTLIQGSKNTVIPNDVESIGGSAFEGVGLTSLTIPNSVTYIDFYAFANNNLTSITIPATVTTIEEIAFANNPLTSITVDPNNPNYDSRDNCNALIATSTNEIVQGSKNTVIPNTVTKIDNAAFKGLGLTSITIPNSVTYIDFYAFADNNLSSINIPSSVSDIDPYAFLNNPLTSITVDSSNSTYDSRDNSNAIIDTANNILIQGSRNTVIPNTVVEIEESAFEGVGLTSINIPASVTNVGGFAFANNPITTLTVSSNTNFYSSNNTIISNDSTYLLQASRNTNFSNLPNTIEGIAPYAFNGLGITSINIPENVYFIGSDAFTNNDNLTSVTMSNTDWFWILYCESSHYHWIPSEIVSNPQRFANLLKSNSECEVWPD